MSDTRRLALSVVVVSLGDARTLQAILDALRTEAATVPLEVILPATARVQRLLEALGQAPADGVRVIPLDDREEDVWRLRARGVAEARAPIVATLEDEAIPDRGWAARVVAAHDEPHAAVGGVVEKLTPDGMTGWAMYFFDYGRYIPPQAAGPRAYLSACNVSYKREAIDRIASVWATSMHETTVHFALTARGETLWLEPTLVVRQRRRLSLDAALRELHDHGRRYGRDLARTLGMPRRLLRLATSPLIPVAHLVRSLRHPVRSVRLLPGYVLALPTLVLFACTWALGEAQGLGRGGLAE